MIPGRTHHDMDFLGVDEDGWEEWKCPTCGCHYFISQADGEVVVPTEGEPGVTHSGRSNPAVGLVGVRVEQP